MRWWTTIPSRTKVPGLSRWLLVAVMLAGLWAPAWALPARAQATQTLVIAPSEDSFVDIDRPTEPLGRWTILRTDLEDEQQSFVRFVVGELAGQAIVQANLRLYAKGSSPAGFQVHSVEGDWAEATLTYSNRPAVGPLLAQAGEHGGARYVTVDLTSYVTGEGTFDLAIVARSTKPVSYPSREAPANRPELVLVLQGEPAPTATVRPPTEPPTAEPPTPIPPTEAPPTEVPPTVPPPTATPSPVRGPGGAISLCGITNAAWTDPGRLLRGGASPADAFECLADFGVDVIVDQREPHEDGVGEAERARAAGIEYINLGVGDDTAPSPVALRSWIQTVNRHLAEGDLVLVHDRAGRGRMGLWDAVYWMMNGLSAQRAIEDRYLAKGLGFTGAKIGCGDGGNGQVQALSEVGLILTGVTYWPSVDEYGTRWANCARPGYMAGWNYASAVAP